MPRVKRLAAPESALKRQKSESFYGQALASIEGLQNEDGDRLLVTAFVKLPSKKLYPDYYTLIESPISLNEINKKVARGSYTDPSEFVDDFRLMFDNAQKYNDPESWIVHDARQLLEHMEKFAEDFGDDVGADVGEGQVTNADLPSLANSLLDELIAYEFPGEGVLSGPFMDVVDPEEYPDYFKVIENPTSFNVVRESIENGTLFSPDAPVDENLQAFYDAVALIFTNAQTYNDPSSLIHEDAKKFQQVFDEKFQALKLESFPDTKLKLKIKPPKEPVKLKLNLKQETPQPPKKRRGRKPKKLIEEEQAALAAAQGSDFKAELEAEPQEDDPDDPNDKSNATENHIMGKSHDVPPEDEVFIRNVTFSSSHTSSQQALSAISSQPYSTLTTTQAAKRSLFPLLSVVNASTLFEYKFDPIGYSTKAYTIDLPAEASSLVSFKVLLHEIICNLKKPELGGQGISQEDFTIALFVNDEEITSGYEMYEDEEHNQNLLAVQYEVKLSYGLNIVNFELRLSPALAKSLRKDAPQEEPSDLGARHTRHQLQQIKLNWEVEKFMLMVNSHSP